LREDVFREAKNNGISDRQARDDREQDETLVDCVLRLAGPGPEVADDAEEDRGHESTGD
jgi:hypothetical protein